MRRVVSISYERQKSIFRATEMIYPAFKSNTSQKKV